MVTATTSVTGVAGRKGAAVGYSGNGWGGDFGAFKNDNVGRAVEDAIAEGVTWLTAQLEEVPWTGTVAMIQGEQVYVNRGTREGVAAGQEFVVGTANVIRDPDTGEVLDSSVAGSGAPQGVVGQGEALHLRRGLRQGRQRAEGDDGLAAVSSRFDGDHLIG